MDTRRTSRPRSPGLSSAAERALRRWESQQADVRRSKATVASGHPAFCITISREAGSRGATVARLVGERLGWTAYDQELLEYIAHEGHLRVGVLESLDEATFEWANHWLARLLGPQWQNQDAYIVHLAKVVLAIGLHGDAVIVGRGAGCIIPRDRSLQVRIIGTGTERTAYLSQLERLTPQEAERHMQDTDAQRSRFVRDYFQRDSSDPHEYDLTLDSSMLGEDCCVDLIVQGLRGKIEFAATSQRSSPRVSMLPLE